MNKYLGCLLFVIVIMVIFAIIGVMSTGKTLMTDPISLCTYSQIEVRKLLKSPNSVEFPLCTEGTLTTDNKGKYRYTSYLNAQNSFGAQLKTDYSCDIRNIVESEKTYYIECELLE